MSEAAGGEYWNTAVVLMPSRFGRMPARTSPYQLMPAHARLCLPCLYAGMPACLRVSAPACCMPAFTSARPPELKFCKAIEARVGAGHHSSPFAALIQLHKRFTSIPLSQLDSASWMFPVSPLIL